MLSEFIKTEEGATAIEYALIAALVAIVMIGAVSSLGGQIGDTFGYVTDAIGGDGSGAGGSASGGGSDFGSGGEGGSGGAGGGFF